MSNISGFKNSLASGGARANQFRVNLSFPAAVNTFGAARAGEFLCEATSLPGSQLGVAQVMYRGRRIPLAGDRTFSPWTVTMINDGEFKMRNAFENWSHYVNNFRDNTGTLNLASYAVDMSVDHLDRNDQLIKTYSFRSAWPISVDPIQLSFGDNDQLERFSVTFEYVSFDTPELA